MLDATPEPLNLATYPTVGVRVAINVHPQTVGGHRVRFSFSPAVAAILRRGLVYPRVHLDGTMLSGFRVWCSQGDDGGYTPVLAHSGAWSFTCPGRKLRCREDTVSSRDVEFQWMLDDSGPMLLIPRLPDSMIPLDVLFKLPNSQVDPETVMQRAETRLQRELAKLPQEIPDPIALPPPEPEPAQAAPEPVQVEPVQAEPGTFSISGRITNPDLLAALNEIRELLKLMRDHADVTAKINMPPELEL